MSAYRELAPFYDRLTEDVDHGAFLRFYEEIFARYGKKPRFFLVKRSVFLTRYVVFLFRVVQRIRLFCKKTFFEKRKSEKIGIRTVFLRQTGAAGFVFEKGGEKRGKFFVRNVPPFCGENDMPRRRSGDTRYV